MRLPYQIEKIITICLHKDRCRSLVSGQSEIKKTLHHRENPILQITQRNYERDSFIARED